MLALPSGTPFEVVYQRITGIDQAPPFTATVEDETVIARGALRSERPCEQVTSRT